MASRSTKQHKELPDNSYIICFICWNHIDREENEISRHFKSAHPQRTEFHGRGNIPYNRCKLIPARVAAELVSQEEVDRLSNKTCYTGINNDPKAPVASYQEILNMFASRQLAAPIWLATIPLVQLPAATSATNTSLPNIATNAIAIAAQTPAQHQAASQTAQAQSQDSQQAADNTVAPSAATNSGYGPISLFSDINSDIDMQDDPSPLSSLYLPLIDQEPHAFNYTSTYTLGNEHKFTCHKCPGSPYTQPVTGCLQSIFCHYVENHTADLRARFIKQYVGRYIKHVYQKYQDFEVVAARVASMGLVPHPPSANDSEEHTVNVAILHCFLCEDEKRFEGFDEFDTHMWETHIAERWEVAEQVMTKFQGEIENEE